MNTRLFSFLILLSIFVILPFKVEALSETHFTTQSKLASDAWVKISVSETGIHQITAKQLAELGFNDISKVKIFGRGGNALSEVLNNNQPDDLEQIPAYYTSDKVIFYAQGVTKIDVNYNGSTPYHTLNVNPYSLKGYYFITDSDKYQQILVNTSESNISADATDINTCYDYVVHYQELVSLLNSGKSFYGENLLADYDLSFSMPNYVQNSPTALYFSIGASSSEKTTVSASINDNIITLSSNTIPVLNSNREFEIISPFGTSSEITPAEKYSLKIDINGTATSLARLDYYTVTYQKTNIFPTDSAQMRMSFHNSAANWNISVDNINEQTILWDVTSGTPTHQITPTANEGKISFRPTTISNWSKYIAFKPAKQLKEVCIEGIIDNQNLHGIETPDMVIIYPSNFKEQAAKLAQIHKNYDNYDVAIVEESQIFNEFSSGAKDATAYRLFLKMLYDRSPQKLKYLLLLGCGSYDNRGVNGKKSENMLLTYQSNDSQGTVSSYVTDDYFGILGDGSGASLPSDELTIAVGRIPAVDTHEAEAVISKIVDYITDESYSSWKNNILLLSDMGDNNLHTTQVEGLEQIIRNKTNQNNLNIEKIFQEWHTGSIIPDNNKTNGGENTGRNLLEKLLKEGVSYISYVGHAGPVVLTYDYRLWTSEKIKNVKYKHMPFFAIAACETAKFDDNGRSFCEELTLAPEGGAIGVLAAARTVYSSQNDKLNKALGEILFTLKEDGSYRTIGEASMEAKKSFGTSYNYNKLSFTLFGDPALSFRFPIDRCKVSSINNIEVNNNSNITTNPLSTISVKGFVADENGSVDESFNGTATITLFDKAIHYKDLVSPSTKVTYKSFYPREKLCHSSGSVENGIFNIDITIPANCKADGDSCLITVFAQSNDKRIVSGSEKRFIIVANKENTEITDYEAPKIGKIFIDGLDASATVNASSNPTIQFTATDNMSISTKPNDLQGSMKLIIDNGKENISLSNHATATNGGKAIEASVQVHNLSTGRHTLRIEVSDYAGNTTHKECIFYVTEDNLEGTLSASTEITTQSVDFMLDTPYNTESCTLFIRDNTEKTILTIQNDGTTFTWNLCDMNGKRVKPGRYTIFATFSGEEGTGVTQPIKIIVLNE